MYIYIILVLILVLNTSFKKECGQGFSSLCSLSDIVQKKL